jgi:putative Ca2+/H+ antiporter (TMEM165/GDT1 family)
MSSSPTDPGPDPAVSGEPIDFSGDTATAQGVTEASAGQSPAAASWIGVFLTTATTVFLAELGDKTQLAALLLSAESGRPVVVFVGASLALICSSLVGVLLGRWLSTVMAPEQLERAAGVLMVSLGLWLGRQAVLNLAPLHLL